MVTKLKYILNLPNAPSEEKLYSNYCPTWFGLEHTKQLGRCPNYYNRKNSDRCIKCYDEEI